MIRFLMDQHIRAEITEGLRRKGIDVLTAFEDHRSDASDVELLQRAAAVDRVFVSQDQDLLRITAQWQ
jgi:predicted nuclease of predicted toxin-antitoxin system